MGALQSVVDGIWCATSHQTFLGIHVGTRMTVLRLGNGSLLLHSPVPITPALRAEVDALGVVRHIVCPNPYHHLYAGEALAAWPQALLHGPASLQRKRKDLRFGATLTEMPHPDWAGQLQLIHIDGCLLDETVFYHPESRTLIASDLVENFHHAEHLPTRWYLKLGGIFGKVGWHRLMRVVYRDRKAARASLERILALPFERVVLAHGDILERDAREQVRQGMSWL